MVSLRYSYCPQCGGRLEARKEEKQHKPQCTSCGFIFYQNPIVGVAAIVIQDRKVLLGKRNTSYAGMWCVPCGYVEWDESVEDACMREFKEETGLQITLERVYHVQSNFHNPKQHTVGIWYLAQVTEGELQAQDDIDELRYVTYADCPPLAFLTDRIVIDKLWQDNLID